MQRMTDVLSQMLNDPMTRAALSAGGEDSLDPNETEQRGLLANSNPEEAVASANQNETAPSGQSEAVPEEASTTENVDTSVVTMETESSESETQPTEVASTSSMTTEPPPPETGSEEGQVDSPACVTRLYSHLTTLRNLRHGFIEQHGSEPSVSLRYSQQSTANATISLRVGDELNRGATFDNDVAMPSTSEATGSEPNSADLPRNSGDDEDDVVSSLLFLCKLVTKHLMEDLVLVCFDQ